MKIETRYEIRDKVEYNAPVNLVGDTYKEVGRITQMNIDSNGLEYYIEGMFNNWVKESDILGKVE